MEVGSFGKSVGVYYRNAGKKRSILAMKLIFLIRHSIVCHDALSFKTSTHHLVQKVKVFKKGWEIGMSGKDFFWKKRNFLNCLDFFLRVMGKLTITIQFFLHEMQSIYIRKFFFSTTTFIIILWLKRINTLCDFCGLLSMYLRTIKDDTNICFINSR